VANGRVYVASYRTLSIFGLSTAPPAALPKIPAPDMHSQLAADEHEIYGIVVAMTGNLVTVRTRDGANLFVDTLPALTAHRIAEPSRGRALLARGTVGTDGVLHADTVLHALSNPRMWPPDRCGSANCTHRPRHSRSPIAHQSA